jgi:hypothetical protein
VITGWGGGKNIFDEVYAPDALWHLPDRDIHGVEQFKRYVTTYVNAFPDASVTVEDEIAEGEKVVNRFTIRGTHQGETEDLGPPTREADGGERLVAFALFCGVALGRSLCRKEGQGPHPTGPRDGGEQHHAYPLRPLIFTKWFWLERAGSR